MTTMPLLDADVKATRKHKVHQLAAVGAWYLLIAAVIRLVIQFDGVRTLVDYRVASVLNSLTFGAAPFTDQFGVVYAIAQVLAMALGVVFLQRNVKVGALIIYALQVASVLLAPILVIVYGYSLDQGFDGREASAWATLFAGILGIMLGLASIIAIFRGVLAIRSDAARPTTGQLAREGEALAADVMPPHAPREPKTGTNVMAILSLVLALGGGLFGVIFGHIALHQIRRTGQKGRGLAIAGLLLGYIVLAFALTVAVLVLSAWVWAGTLEA